VLRVEPGAAPLREAIAALVAAPCRREQLASAARAWAAEHSWASVAAAHVRIYDEARAAAG
jgi:hypothetical protein